LHPDEGRIQTPPMSRKGSGPLATQKKIGKANVRQIPTSPEFNNAVAYIDGKTLLIGRYSTVSAALKNPKAGAVRFGLDALGVTQRVLLGLRWR